MPAYFTPDFLEFFRELAANNNRDWFLAQKKRYEKNVKEPFATFIGLLIGAIQQHDQTVQITPSQAIFRINRDVRFSNDKSPYKIQASAHIVPGTRKNMGYPGMYLEFTPEHCGIYGGLYMPDKTQLTNIREAIAENPSKIGQLLAEPDFVQHYGTLLGEQNQRLPKPFQDVREQQPLIANKQFYFAAELPPETILREDLLEFIMNYYHAAKAMNRYLQQAMVLGRA